MKKIDKSKILSSRYKEWVDKLDKENKKHPLPKSNDRHYYDVVMNLLHCQKGVCAYTESFLCKAELYSEDKWEDGKYKIKKPKRFGHLEHFNPALKKKKGYEWANLFVAFSDINVLKGENEVDDILKPDSPHYDPMALLEYDIETHFFIPHTEIKNEKLRKRIDHMLDLLQVNHDTIHTDRRKFLTSGLEYREMNRDFEVYKYFTACRMIGLPVEGD